MPGLFYLSTLRGQTRRQTGKQTDKKIIKNNRQNILHYRKRLHYLCADKKTTDKTDKTDKTKQTDNDSDNADRQ